MPLYAFFLPLYAFWHFDDFSWGSTRRVDTDDYDGTTVKDSQETFDPTMITRKPWASYVDDDLDWRVGLDV